MHEQLSIPGAAWHRFYGGPRGPHRSTLDRLDVYAPDGELLGALVTDNREPIILLLAGWWGPKVEEA
jgi:hypothetical protein